MLKWNRSIAAILSAALVISMAPAGAIAAVNPTAQEDNYENNEDTDEAQLNGTEEADSGSVEAGGSEANQSGMSGDSDEENTDTSDEQEDGNENTSEDAGESSSEEDEDGAFATDDAAQDALDGAEASETSASDEGDEEVASGGMTEAATENADAAKTGEAANKEIKTIPAEVSQSRINDGEEIDSDALFEQFLNKIFYGGGSAKRKLRSSFSTGSQLTGVDRKIYDGMRQAVSEIAAGNRDTGLVTVQVDLSDLGLKNEYTAQELGLTFVYKESTKEWNPDIHNAVGSLCPIDYGKINHCLIADCAFEFFPLESGIGHYSIPFSISGSDDEWNVVFEDTVELTLFFTPISSFAREDPDDEFAIDSAKIQSVLNAADNAKEIVRNAAGKSDYYKLEYYKEMICDLVSYDDDARAGGANYPDKSPWTLLYVFDGKSSTNVVCEGYSEAFQYLCELTDFDGDTYAYSVTGDMGGGTGAGPHKWNIVHIGGANYIADITNSDAGAVGSDGKVFLKGMQGSVDDGYIKSWPETTEENDLGDGRIEVITHPGGSISYVYDDETKSIFSVEELTLSETDYGALDPQTVDDKASLKGMSVFLTDQIGMRVYVKPGSDGLKDSDKIVFSYADKTVEQTAADASKDTITDYNGEEIEVLRFELKMPAKNMTDEVSFHMVIDGAAGTDKIYSVRSYADVILNGDYSEQDKAMVRAMLNYGGYAQQYFGYNVSNLANDSIFEDGTDPVSQETPDLSAFDYTVNRADDTKGFHLRQVTLNLGSEVSLVFFYDLDEGKTKEDYEFTLTNANNELKFDYEASYFKSEYVMVCDIMPEELGKQFTLSVTPKGETQSVTTISYSPLTYCKNKIEKSPSENLRNTCKAIYYYWKAAKEFTP